MPSPVAAVETMTFYDALKFVATGAKIKRQSWPEADAIFLHAEVLHLRKADGSLHTLIVSAADIEGVDWVVVRDN